MSKSNPMHRRQARVFTLPKGTLHPECPTQAIDKALEALRQAELGRMKPVIHSRGQGREGYATPPQNRMVESGAAPRERGWNPHGARTLPVKAL